MRVGLLAPITMPGQTIRLANSLRQSFVGLHGIIGIGPPTWMPKWAVSFTSRLRRGEALSTLLELRRRFENVDSSVVLRQASNSSPSSTTHNYCRRYGLQYWHVPETNHASTAEVLRHAGLDFIVACGAGILRPLILDVPGVTFINAHAGRLPKYGGMNVVEWAVYNGDPVYGTVHRMDKGIDTGEILQEAPLKIGRPSTIAALRAAAFAAAWDMVPGALTKLAKGELRFRKQPNHLARIQWYRMQGKLLKVVQVRLDDKSFFAIQERCLDCESNETLNYEQSA